MKSIAAAIVTVMTASLLSMLALGVGPAQANHYGPDVSTFCSVFARDNPMRAGNRNKVIVNWRAENGATPVSVVRYSIIKRRTGVVVASGAVTDADGRTAFRTNKIPRGRYRVRAKVNPQKHKFTNARCSSGLRSRR